MNEKQREFIITKVTQAAERELEMIEDEKKPVEPSLNNYLVSAILTDKLVMQDIASLREKIRKRVITMGPNDTFVKEKDDWNRRKSNQDTVTLDVADIFVYPEEYVVAKAEYDSKVKAYNKTKNEILARRDSIIVKIKIGSDKVLQKLIEQADNLIDLDLTSTQLLLTN